MPPVASATARGKQATARGKQATARGKSPGSGGLGAYRAKRDLRHSPEPAGGKRRGHARPRFVVQQHQASTLHFDFRLEVGGVLKSWALPKGPSANPADKRLAIPTEDHPLEYEDFEGTIPEGEYGAGQVIVWDRGGYDNKSEADGTKIGVEEAIERGHLSFSLHGKKLRGGYTLTRMRRGGRDSWLLVKKADGGTNGDPVRDEPASVKSGMTIQRLGGER